MAYTGDVAIFRFLVNGGHFYTADCNEAQTVLSNGGEFESVQCYLSSSAAGGLVPLYRFLLGGGMHFYTANETEKNAVVANGGVLEGVIGYVSSSATADTVPLYRALNPNNGDHFYTTDQGEWNNAVAAGMSGEGITGYVSDNHTNNCAAFEAALTAKANPTDDERVAAYEACVASSDDALVKEALPFVKALINGDPATVPSAWLKMVENQMQNPGFDCLTLLTDDQQKRVLAQVDEQRANGQAPGPGMHPIDLH